MSIKFVDKMDSSFELNPECEDALKQLMRQDNFLVEVAAQKGWKEEVEYTGVLFQPIPWTRTERHGMPKACEKYLNDSENHVIVNVPPTFMFKAKIFNPHDLQPSSGKKVHQSRKTSSRQHPRQLPIFSIDEDG
eukprot:CAMPEP_0118929562 /NCGR_PEP_ID=MMETSP1169-20130426/6523_1 /TAXON_ID=36882 /ORGANISM="Pyramimonas obovata, Strain CCMP722" /LENGTH=133 /DNA_ID=CAMNT_0006871777 /DNA_START=264 /DNA_END=666 /DNA_ORIENTATION=+